VSTTIDTDIRFMRMAIALARRGLGATWPNPSVGCVLVRDNIVLGRGWTQPGGRPHAETEAIARANNGSGQHCAGATAYVSLEPCAHHGRTPPCADALIDAGVTRVVVGLGDPDPRVDGGGIDRLRKAGVEVVEGVCEAEAAKVAAGFVMRITRSRPLVTLKIATTLDGRIATGSGHSQWITGEISRAFAHGLRANHDAILVGAGTAVADNPSLSCRLPGLGNRSPVRVVIDGAASLPLTHELIAGASVTPSWVLAPPGRSAIRRKEYDCSGVEVMEIAAERAGEGGAGDTVDLAEGLRVLAGRGITRLLVEGGGRIAASLLRQGLVDRIVWFRAPRIIGGDGLPAAAGFGVDLLDQAPEFIRLSTRATGDDLMEIYARAEDDEKIPSHGGA
jgi:diaminohydroxyphosphoribosylaminopyrimidine deaminase / 5-amino-6-(5-phosphoribosylamino)uracil reductase